MKLSVVIPCYNEAQNIPLILEKLQALKQAEVILVDNGSTDNTAFILKEELAQPQHSFIRTVKVEKNIGYGFGVMSGIRASSGEIISWTHADLQTDPSDVLRAYAIFVKQRDPTNTFLKGKRRNRPLIDEFFTFMMAVVCTLALGQVLSDINAQPKMFHRKFMDKLTDPPNDFSLDLYALYQTHRYRMKIIEIPVFFGKRLYGQAKGGGSWKTKWKLVKRSLSYIFMLRRKITRQK